MPLKPISELVQHAREHSYALGYFESWNLESLQGVLDAAEATQSPIIIGFNGEFLSRPDRKLSERLRCYAELGKAAAACATVPCGLIFNECPDDQWVRNAVLAGFNLVMPADPAASYEDYSSSSRGVDRVCPSPRNRGRGRGWPLAFRNNSRDRKRKPSDRSRIGGALHPGDSD